MSFETFLRFLAEGPKRAPRLYAGKMVHQAAPNEKKADSVVPKAIAEAPGKDWQSKAAGDDWDGYED